MDRPREPVEGKFTVKALAWLLAFGIGLPAMFYLLIVAWSWLSWRQS